jgi:hypothetical protein
MLGEILIERHRYVGFVLPEKRLHDGKRGRNRDNLESAAGCETRSQLLRRVIRGWIDYDKTYVAYVTAQCVTEEHDLHERHQQQDCQRLPVAENVPELLYNECTERSDHAGLASRTKSSSIVGTFHFVFSSPGLPIVAILPATMMEIRSQYSASSM